MPDSRTYYVISDDNCKFESMTKEQILAAITQAVETHEITDVDTGFVTTLQERNRSNGLKFWVGSTAQYNAITTKEENCFYILMDDTELEDLETSISNLQNSLSTLGTNVNELTQEVDTEFDKKGFEIFTGEIRYGTDHSVTVSTGDYKISDFNVVSVNGVICSVTPDEQTPSTVYIRGTGTGQNSDMEAVENYNINITCSISQDVTTLTNFSAVVLISIDGIENVYGLSIHKIIGIA